MQTIDILLATYNGEKYLKELLDSLFAQTYQNWSLLIRDDGSTDITNDIIENYRSKYPNKIKFINDNEKNLGPCQNFARLIAYSKAEYIMFCDQDDIWDTKKIEISYNQITKLEKKYGNIPILVHTDQKLVNSQNNIIAHSRMRFQQLDPKLANNPKKLLSRNVVTGATIIMNSQCKSVGSPIPKEAIMHDWWIAVNVAKYGIIDFIDVPYILYRQHEHNEVGASEIDYRLPDMNKTKQFIQNIKNILKMKQKLNFKISSINILVYKFYLSIKNRMVKI